MRIRSGSPRAAPALGLLCFGIVLGAGGAILAQGGQGAAEVQTTEVLSGQTDLINPLLGCIDPLQTRETVPFKPQIKWLTNQIIESEDAQEISLYFRDLNNGPWFSIGGELRFRPGSLYKVPLLLAMLRAAEGDPTLLDSRLRFDLKNVPLQYFEPADSLEPGKDYSVRELLERMVLYSDNRATGILANAAGDRYTRVFTDLGIIVDDPSQPLTDVRSYASFFRVLYNSSYLSRQRSQEALELLTRARLKRGVVAGLPSGTRVAHKFGTVRLPDMEQFHDCGIVYVPDHPYLLCVMTRGRNIEKLIEVTASLSKEVYEQVRDGPHLPRSYDRTAALERPAAALPTP